MPNTDLILARIRLLKYLFLSAGLCVLIGIFATIYAKDMSDHTLSETSTLNLKPKLKKNHTLSIKRSIFEGLSKDLMPYKIFAKNVTRNSNNKYQLNTVNGSYLLKNGDLKLKANTGTIDMETKLVTLQQDVRIILNETVFNSEEIKINLNNKNISSDTNVEVTLKESNIKADKFEVMNSGNDIKFEGNIKFESDIKFFNLKTANK